eukprot:86610-Rhodomonas_salina.5
MRGTDVVCAAMGCLGTDISAMLPPGHGPQNGLGERRVTFGVAKRVCPTPCVLLRACYALRVILLHACYAIQRRVLCACCYKMRGTDSGYGAIV